MTHLQRSGSVPDELLNPTLPETRQRMRHMTRIKKTLAAVALSATGLLMSGCAGFNATSAGPVQVSMATMNGSVHGGQQPVSGATVQLYQAGTTGYGTGALALIAGGVVTDGGGGFTLTGKYSCTSGSQLYVTATGGNPGGGTNSALSLIAAIGLCDNAPSIPFIQINEVTTVGTVWALAPFMNGLNIGAPTTNQTGLANAFADVNTLVNYANGSTPGPLAPAGSTVPVAEIAAIANSLAACVNTQGTGGGGPCDQLFSYATSGTSVPADVVSAAINIARHPGVNANQILALRNANAPFASNFTSANDLTLAVTYTGSGLNAPTGVAVDAAGNLWVTNSGSNSVSKLSHTGAPLSGTTGFTAGPLSAPTAIAIDTAGNAWVANAGNSTLTKLTPTGTPSTYSGGGLASPSSVAIDGLGAIWLSNPANSSVSEFSSAGTAVSPAGTGFSSASGSNISPVGVAINPH